MMSTEDQSSNGQEEYSSPCLSDCRSQLVRTSDEPPFYICHTPQTFLTPSQLLQLRFGHFLALQKQLKSSLSLLSTKPSSTTLKNYVAIVGSTSQPRLLSHIAFSDTDPIAKPALSSLLGPGVDINTEQVILLDRLDIAELIGEESTATKTPPSFTLQASGRGLQSQTLVADMVVSSLLQDASQCSEVALSSVQSLFQCAGPIPVPALRGSSVPVPFHRVCLLLRQHLYWVPTSNLNSLNRKREGHGNQVDTFLCGPRGVVRCVCVTDLHIEELMTWYQMTLARQLLLHIEPTSDIWNSLSCILK